MPSSFLFFFESHVSGLIVEGDRRVCPLLKSLSRQVSHSLSLSLSPSLSLAVAPFFFSLPCFLSLPSLQVYFSLLPCFFFSLPSCSSSSLGPHISQPFANSRDEQIPRPLCLIMDRLLFGHTRESSLVTEACLAGSKKAGLWAWAGGRCVGCRLRWPRRCSRGKRGAQCSSHSNGTFAGGAAHHQGVDSSKWRSGARDAFSRASPIHLQFITSSSISPINHLQSINSNQSTPINQLQIDISNVSLSHVSTLPCLT